MSGRKQRQQAIVDAAMSRAGAATAGLAGPGGCLYLASAVVYEASKVGLRLVLQAGSAHWRRITSELDDGVVATHFGYTWDPESDASKASMASGHLPEMHCWAADPRRMEIIDLTVGLLPQACEGLGNMPWLAAQPPAHLWRHVERLPGGWVYRVDPVATKFAVECLRRIGERRDADVEQHHAAIADGHHQRALDRALGGNE